MTTKATTKTGPKGIPAPKPRATAAVAAYDRAAATASAADGAEKATALKLRELVDRVVGATGAKKKVARELVEATLAQLGAALAKGEELNLPGVGKVRVAKSADKAGRSLMTLKVRSAGAAKAKEPLAEVVEDV
jgi:DNA-binding protein HU-alpha